MLRLDVAAHFDTLLPIDWIAPRPLLMIAGTDANTLMCSKEENEKAVGDKELFLIEG